MLSDNDVKILIKELEEGLVADRGEDQFGYALTDAYDVYRKIIKRVKEMDRTEKKGEEIVEVSKIKVNMEFKPTLLITASKEKLGSLTFDNAEDMGEFMNRLSQAIKRLIKEFEDEKERSESGGAKCRS